MADYAGRDDPEFRKKWLTYMTENFDHDFPSLIKCRNPGEDILSCKNYTIERCFPLEQDKETFGEEVQACARIIVNDTGRVKETTEEINLPNGKIEERKVVVPIQNISNRMILKRKTGGGVIEGEIDCIHTAIQNVSVSQFFEALTPEQQQIYAQSTENLGEVAIHPWDHFSSLKSYIGGIAEVGLFNLAAESAYEVKERHLQLAFGYNEHMVRQVSRELNKIFPKKAELMTKGHLRGMLTQIANEETAFKTMKEFIEKSQQMNLSKLRDDARTLYHIVPTDNKSRSEIIKDLKAELAANMRSNLRESYFKKHFEALNSQYEIATHSCNDIEIAKLAFEIFPHHTSTILAECARNAAGSSNNIIDLFVEHVESSPDFDLNSIDNIIENNMRQSDKLFDAFSRSKNPQIRARIATHPFLPPNILERLKRDEDETVKNTAISTTEEETRKKLLEKQMLDPLMLSRLARGEPFSQDYLKRIVETRHTRVLVSVAQRHDTTADILFTIARGSNRIAKMIAATNNNATPDVLNVLVQDEDPIVQSIARVVQKQGKDSALLNRFKQRAMDMIETLKLPT